MMSQSRGGTIVSYSYPPIGNGPSISATEKGGNPTFVPGRWRIYGWDSAPGSLGFVFGWGS